MALYSLPAWSASGSSTCTRPAAHSAPFSRSTASSTIGIATPSSGSRSPSLVDATDGFLARRADVAARTPRFNGGKLDDIVDYLTYVFVPAFFVWHALLVPDRWSTVVVAAMLLSSAYGFCQDAAKTPDHFFTGFPSYWNIVVFYLYVARWTPADERDDPALPGAHGVRPDPLRVSVADADLAVA